MKNKVGGEMDSFELEELLVIKEREISRLNNKIDSLHTEIKTQTMLNFVFGSITVLSIIYAIVEILKKYSEA